MLNSNERIIKHKVGLLNLAEELGNVSQACKVMGMSRDTFYRYKAAVEDGGAQRCWRSPAADLISKIARMCSGLIKPVTVRSSRNYYTRSLCRLPLVSSIRHQDVNSD